MTKKENSAVETGGPAFPQHTGQSDVAGYGGMTLRDYFAAKAMAAIAVRDGGFDEAIAQQAYELADAMLAARKQGD